MKQPSVSRLAAGALIVLALFGVYGCQNEQIAFKKGEQAYAIGEYYTAAYYFKQSYSRCKPKDKPKRAIRAYMMGDCYRRINYVQKAVAAYQNAVRFNYPDSMALFYLAQQQLKLGNYKAAEENFSKFLILNPNDELADNGLRSCTLAQQWKENPNQYQIKRETVFNSRRSDFSPMLVGEDQLVLTSTRSDATGDDYSGITGVKFADLFLARKDEAGKWKGPEVVESEVNTEYDEGVCCFSPDGRTMYFTRCSSDPDYPRNAEIWQSARSDAQWAKPTKLEISKDTLTNFAHPAMSPDGTWLYFTSDMPGGIGGYDIWRTRIVGGQPMGVENLGRPINTPGDEKFPSFRPNGDLYFSSDGHPGMGGLDILIARQDSGGRWTVENQQYPLNSPADDFGMTFDGLHNRGFFATSRGDGKGWEHIYSFECPEILQTVVGWVYEKDGYELPQALVYMVGNDGTNEKLSVKGDGSFTQVVEPGVDYVFLATCEGYLNVRNELSVVPVQESQEHVLQFPLPPINIPVLIDNIFYEFDKATLTPESTDALDKLVLMMNENPTITIELASHCDYRGSDDYNQRLSQRRAQSVVDYMIEHGIAADRMTAMGYGEGRPKVIRRRVAEQNPFLAEGDTLTEEYIRRLPNEEQQEIANALNRRTEFSVLRTTYGLTLEELRNTPNAAGLPPEEETSPSDPYEDNPWF